MAEIKTGTSYYYENSTGVLILEATGRYIKEMTKACFVDLAGEQNKYEFEVEEPSRDCLYEQGQKLWLIADDVNEVFEL